MPDQERPHSSLECAVDRAAVDRVRVEGPRQGPHAVSTSAAVLLQELRDGPVRHHSRLQDLGERCSDASAVDGAQVEQHPHRCRRRNSSSDDGTEVGEISWVMDDDVVTAGTPGALGDDHVDRIVDRPRHAPHVRRRTVRAHRTGSACPHRSQDQLLTGDRRSRQARDARVDQLERAAVDRPVPGGRSHADAGGGVEVDETEMGARERADESKFHAHIEASPRGRSGK